MLVLPYSKIPTIAIEHVYIWINTTLIQDEVLAQRLGLIPISCDPELVEWRNGMLEYCWHQFYCYRPDINLVGTASSGPTDANTIVFKLSATCERHRGVSKDETDPNKLFTKPALYSSDIIFAPKGDQSTRFVQPPEPVHHDILIAKMRPGQEVVLEMHCEKGIAKDHAKWSPVGMCQCLSRILHVVASIHFFR